MGPGPSPVAVRYCRRTCLVVSLIAVAAAMLWLMWCYFGLSAVHFSQGQRRALVSYAVVTAKPTPEPPDSSAANAISRAQVTTPSRRSEVRSRPDDPNRTRAVNASILSKPDPEGKDDVLLGFSTVLPSIQNQGKTNGTVLNSKDEFISTSTTAVRNSSLDIRNDTTRESSVKPPVLPNDDVRVPDFERDSSRPASKRRDRDDDDRPSSTGRDRDRLGEDRLLKGDSKVHPYDDGFRDEIPRTRGDEGDGRDHDKDFADRPRHRDEYLEPRRWRGSETAYDEKDASDYKRRRDDDLPLRRGDRDDEVYRDKGDREYYPRRDRVSSEDRVRSDRDYPVRKSDDDYDSRRDKTDEYQPRRDRTDDYVPNRRDSSSRDRDYPSRRDRTDTDYSTRDRDRDDRDYSRDRTDEYYSAKDRTDRDERYYPSRSDRDRNEKRGDLDRDLPSRRDSSDRDYQYRSEKTEADFSPARDISGRGDIRDSSDRVNRDRGEIDRVDSVTSKLDRDLRISQPSRDKDISPTRNRDSDPYYSSKGDEHYDSRSRIRTSLDKGRYDDDSYLEKRTDQAQGDIRRDYDIDERRRIIVESDRSKRPGEYSERRTDDDFERSKGDSYSRSDERRRDGDRYESRLSEDRDYRDDRVPVREDRYKEDSRRDDLIRVPLQSSKPETDRRQPVSSSSERYEPSISRKPMERDGIVTSSRDRISPSRVSGSNSGIDYVDSKSRDRVHSTRISEDDRYRYKDEDTGSLSRDRISPSRVRSEMIDESYSRSRDSLRPLRDDRIRDQEKPRIEDRDEVRGSSSYDGKSRSRPVGDGRDIVVESRSYASDDEYRRSNDGSRHYDRSPTDERRRYPDDDYYQERPKVRSQEDSKRRDGDDDPYYDDGVSDVGLRKGTSDQRSDRRNKDDLRRGARPDDLDERYQGRGDSGRSEVRNPSKERDSSRAISVKDVIEGALHRSDVSDRDSKEVLYPVFNPKVYNLTSSDIIRPSERRAIAIASKRKR